MNSDKRVLTHVFSGVQGGAPAKYVGAFVGAFGLPV